MTLPIPAGARGGPAVSQRTTPLKADSFRVGLTADFLDGEGNLPPWDVGIDILRAVTGDYVFMPDVAEVEPEMIAGLDAVVARIPRFTARTLEGVERLTILARFGVGYDTVDIPACTRAGVVVTITPDGVRRSMAETVLTMLFALSHRLTIKERDLRAGRWQDRVRHFGIGLERRTLGLIGIGNIGAEVFRLAAPLGMRHLAHDPYADPAAAAELNITLVGLETLLHESDFLSVNCPLNDETRHLIGAGELALMKPTAYLINTARGGVVDQAALAAALCDDGIAGAGVDVFEQEPIDPNDPLLDLDNVILTPHNLNFTDASWRDNGESAFRAVARVARGEAPPFVVNPEVLETELFRKKLARYR